MAIDFDIRDPKNQRILAVFMCGVVLMYCFHRFMINPKAVELKKTTEDIAALQNQLNTMRGNLQAKKILLADKESLELKLGELETYLPENENVAVLLDQFSMVENNTKVYVMGFKANETVEDKGKPYLANRYKVTIEAGYHQFVEFMSGIMALPRILSFSEMKISPNPNAPRSTDVNEGLEDQPRSLSIECSITTYVFRGISGEASKAEGKKP